MMKPILLQVSVAMVVAYGHGTSLSGLSGAQVVPPVARPVSLTDLVARSACWLPKCWQSDAALKIVVHYPE